MKKGICPHCQKPVAFDEEKAVNNCPHCQKDYLSSQSEKLFGLMYSQHISNGNIALNTSRNYDKALAEYQKLLALDEESMDAVFGVAISKMSLAKLGENIIPELREFLNEKLDKIAANEAYIPEMSRNLLAVGIRYDTYIGLSEQALIINAQYIDEGAKERHIEIIATGIVLWNLIACNLQKIDMVEQLPYSQERITNLKKSEKEIMRVEVISKGTIKYDEIKDNGVFENRVSLYKLRISFVIAQVIFVIGAIIGFSVMMSNYGTNPIPGLIIFGVFAILFLGAYIGGRILKNKLTR
ncbi:MAG: hypothetical protein WC286_05540 [Bacilli bacterium]|jgi:tetratricopeptide (TPR) repeat protein